MVIFHGYVGHNQMVLPMEIPSVFLWRRLRRLSKCSTSIQNSWQMWLVLFYVFCPLAAAVDVIRKHQFLSSECGSWNAGWNADSSNIENSTSDPLDSRCRGVSFPHWSKMVAHPGTACGNTWDPLKGMPLTWRLFHLSLRLWNIVNSFWICLALLILFVDTGIWRKKLWWTRQSVFRFNHPLKEPQRYIWDLECGAFHGIPNGDFWSFGRGLIQSTQVEPSSKEHENDRCQPGWCQVVSRMFPPWILSRDRTFGQLFPVTFAVGATAWAYNSLNLWIYLFIVIVRESSTRKLLKNHLWESQIWHFHIIRQFLTCGFALKIGHPQIQSLAFRDEPGTGPPGSYLAWWAGEVAREFRHVRCFAVANWTENVDFKTNQIGI